MRVAEGPRPVLSVPARPGVSPAPPVCPLTGKRCFGKAAAKREAAWWRRRWMARMEAYPCPSGGHWHVGNDRPRKPRRRRGKAHRK